MKSPFLGMDPYLERYWRDVHQRLCIYACDALQPQLLPALRARVEERLVVESDWSDPRSIYPDVKIIQHRDRSGAPGDAAVATAPAETGTALAEPLILRSLSEQPTEGYITIIDPSTGGRLVTVIEILSTSNKVRGKGQELYQAKQQELEEAGVSLVEIDLLRTGDWILQAPLREVPAAYRPPYRVCVRRGWKSLEWELYNMPLDRPLPSIRIPLRQQDPDARLDLQALIEQVYRNGAYDDIDYTKPPEPPLDPDVQSWANSLLRERGRNKE